MNMIMYLTYDWEKASVRIRKDDALDYYHCNSIKIPLQSNKRFPDPPLSAGGIHAAGTPGSLFSADECTQTYTGPDIRAQRRDLHALWKDG